MDTGWLTLNFFAKSSILDVWLGSEYVYAYSFKSNLPECFEFNHEEENNVNKVALVSLLLTWDMITRLLSATSDSDFEANTVRNDTDQVTRLRLN